MKAFMDRDFLLESETAKILYHKYAAPMPIVDYHCHISAREIALDRQFDNITQMWLGGDHYKWRLMRWNGVPEKYITGDAPDREKFQKWAETLERAIGNPLYHWSHMELRQYFGYQGILKVDTAGQVWDLCNEKLKSPEMSARNIIMSSNVKILCTTDDPADDLHYHKLLRQDNTFPVQVYPAFRPERAMNIGKKEFAEYIHKLEQVTGFVITSMEDLQWALRDRMDFFDKLGCRTSDHSLDYAMYAPASAKQIDAIFQKALAGEPISYQEEQQYKMAFLLFVGKEYQKRGWVMQLHYGVKRDNDAERFQKLGPDTGFDCINTYTPSAQLAELLNALSEENGLPRTIVYSLNPADNTAIGSVIGCFQDDTCPGKIQQGSAWWFNDNKQGIQAHLTSLANQGMLANFVGMLTDSRSFLSYTRHEYFRRILCDLLGEWVEKGEYPWDEKCLGRIVEDISYHNVVKYFSFF